MPKTDLTNDELRDDIQEGLLEAERRLIALGKPRVTARARLAHALLSDVEKSAHEHGEISTLSIGGDKGD